MTCRGCIGRKRQRFGQTRHARLATRLHSQKILSEIHEQTDEQEKLTTTPGSWSRSFCIGKASMEQKEGAGECLGCCGPAYKKNQQREGGTGFGSKLELQLWWCGFLLRGEEHESRKTTMEGAGVHEDGGTRGQYLQAKQAEAQTKAQIFVLVWASEATGETRYSERTGGECRVAERCRGLNGAESEWASITWGRIWLRHFMMACSSQHKRRNWFGEGSKARFHLTRKGVESARQIFGRGSYLHQLHV